MKGLPLPSGYQPRTVPALLAERAARHPDQTAVHAKAAAGYVSRTFAELARDVRTLAGQLRARAVQPGDRVAWQIGNRRGLDAIRLYHAVLWAGAVNVPVNTRLAAPEIADLLRRSACRLLIADPGAAEPASDALGSTALVSLDDLAAASAGTAGLAAPAARADQDIAAILFTSGTTGRAKGVVHTHGSSLAAAIGWSEALGLGTAEVLQSPFPIFSGAGLHFNGLACLWGSAEFVIDDYDTTASLELAAARGSTVYVAVPSVYAFWLDCPSLDPRRLTALRLLDYGGAPMAPALIEDLRARLPSVGLMQTYGLTEAGPGGTFLPPDQALRRLGSIGRQCAGTFTQVRVVGPDGSPAASGQPGELLLRGPAVMDGYLDDPVATAEAFDGEWLRSGDIVRADDDGYLYVVDRKKDIVVRGGYNVSSAEVEAALLAHPDILEAAVVGVPHARLGEDVHAIVVARAGAAVDTVAVGTFVRERVADFKAPNGYTVVSALPRNAAGKVMKPVLRDLVAPRPE
jgi:acyl-CoA synthetase (AMP-forming)/AMP-acid ligase II